MTPDVVVDIGNSRVKWGRCLNTVTDGGMVSLPPGDLNAWDDQAEVWQLGLGSWWAIGGVNPEQVRLFAKWVNTIGGTAAVFSRPSDLPIQLALDEPDSVGIDRIFGAIAARANVPPRTPAITVDVGTAVTVNLIDSAGIFRGGAIFPGPRLMAAVLHEKTAALPEENVTDLLPVTVPGRNTREAIRAGIGAAIQGGIGHLVEQLADRHPRPWLFLTGGGRGNLSQCSFRGVERVVDFPELNLEGLRMTAEIGRG